MSLLTDTSTWLPLDGLAPGFDANKAPLSTELEGRTLTVLGGNGTRVEHRFGAGTVTWVYSPGDGDPTPAGSETEACEVFRVDDDLFYVQFHKALERSEAVSLFLDLRAGRSLTVEATIGDPEPGTTRVRQVFHPGVLEGFPVAGDEPAPTTSLVGRRVMWVYSEQHAYEHVYLSPQWYTWQCLAGPERGLADTDENSVWQLRPGIYVFTWREKVIPCASVTVADHRDARAIRSHGCLFGLDATGNSPVHFTFGAFGRLISTTVHPDPYDPALS
jgi:hypothetical protein